MKYIFVLLLLPFLFLGCSEQAADSPGVTEPAEAVSPFAGRIDAATARLSKTPASQLVAAAISAHGGLEKWYSQSPLYFHFDYRPVGEGTIRDSYSLNDYVNARSIHQSVDQEGVSYGFDGKNAWKAPAESEPTVSPRFWSLTPYYFVGLPFVLADEGINFEQLPDGELNGVNYHKVKVTYDAGTGDAADDYYVLWLHPTTKQLDALNYIVSYPGFFKDGGHLPEKLMVLSGKTTVAGIVLPTGYTTRWSDKPEEVITNISVSDYDFRPGTNDSAFEMPDNGVVYTDLTDD
ncbi:DUF6503 family protein [Neolewinella persica]|uniref:DUF6503 family protein n=1 Tax=Neolewinella persica TaxID=70998 RepID=UPI00036FD1B2|nr:DUF6503 family protein [Neolewinella persica]